jgi:hypothetical protein
MKLLKDFRARVVPGPLGHRAYYVLSAICVSTAEKVFHYG